jgi:hypothetical protein
MKTQPAPQVPGDTDKERFDSALRKMFTVTKEEMRRREAEWRKIQDGKTQPEIGCFRAKSDISIASLVTLKFFSSTEINS